MHRTLRLPFSAALAALGIMMATVAGAEIPKVISYQGRITDASGTPVPDNNYTMQFRIYNVATGGTSLWDSGTRSIAVSGGIFNVLLGESPQPALNLAFDADYWLLVTFAGADQTPRQRLVSTGYAYMASGLVPGTEVVGSVASSISGAIKAVNTSGSGTRFGGYFMSQSTSGKGVYGEGPHTGVYGKATGTTGALYGGSFISYSPQGYGVYGAVEATTGLCYGGYFASLSNSGRGVHGEAPHTGVYGRSTATSGEHYGGSFVSYSSQGCGIYSENLAGGWAGYFMGDVNIDGNLTVSGSSFPAPAYDSGWQAGTVGGDVTLTHSVGGNITDYVVDIQHDVSGLGVTNRFAGADVSGWGFFWHSLTSTTLQVKKGSNMYPGEKFRVRIWRY
ncbi:hypothetical protein JXA88_04655 [Candidatus Fermentibacteria bacterium]|nr:hypothetical protein [Candidatus Fermentibacteria bacterium]